MEYKGLLDGIVPAILAGVIGAGGAYTALKEDVAVIKSNQTHIIKEVTSLKSAAERSVRNQDRIDFIQFQIDNMRNGKLVLHK